MTLLFHQATFILLQWPLFVFYAMIVAAAAEEKDNLYELLGIDKDADDKTMRRAFKKLAMTKHPDKNKDDPDAHDIFVRINRAYEVLKDPDLRKKYDLYGEAGLKEDFQGGHQYQSWQFYRDNFGIYDEDPEIVTLTRADFDQLQAGGETWFVNFYSPQCSHCHTLAPTWRRVARLMDGVMRIGAVNCGDDWGLCREQAIFGYPSLVFYPSRRKYEGDRSEEHLIETIMAQAKYTVHQVTASNVVALSQEWSDYSHKAWIIDFCDDTHSCISKPVNRQRLAAMLDGLANVGTVDCTDDRHKGALLCETLDQYTGVLFFPAGLIDKEHKQLLSNLDVNELSKEVLHLLPDVKQIEEQEFYAFQSESDEQPYLVHFVEKSEQISLDMKKLPSLVDMAVLRVNCSSARPLCARLHIHKTPSFALFKPSGGYELHYGRQSASDVAAFVRDSAHTNVQSIGPDEYKELLADTGNTWMVDFFAPWCPPCMKLLPEFRKASRALSEDPDMEGTVRFGTVDCTVHAAVCQQASVHSYPTTVLYNATKPFPFVGLHNMHELIDFVEEIRQPLVQELDSASFKRLVEGRDESGVAWMVDLFAPWCGHCMELAPQWRKLAKLMKDDSRVQVASVDCDQQPALCQRLGVRSYPTIMMYVPGQTHASEFNHWQRDAFSLRQWAASMLPSKVRALESSEFFSDVLQSSEPWLLDFYAPWCGHCVQFAPEFDLVAEALDGKVRLAKVNCDAAPKACQAAGVRAYPTLRYYAGVSADGETQNSYGEDIDSQQSQDIIELITQKYLDTFTDRLRTQESTLHEEL